MFIDQSDLIANAEIFDVDTDDNFVETLAQFTDVISIFPDLKSCREALKKAQSFVGFIFKGIEFKEKYEYDGLAATFSVGNILKSDDNNKYHKRIILSEDQGKQLRNMLNFDRVHSKNLLLFKKIFQDKYLQESEHSVTVNVDNILTEENDIIINDINFRIISYINHGKFIDIRKLNACEMESKYLYLQSMCDNKTNVSNSTTQSNQLKLFDTVCLFFHGGGYCSGGNYHHQIYTNIIAKQFPVISLDQRLAPEHKYPAAINDAYRMIIQIKSNIHLQLGYTPVNIILSGDSAGGNLACNIMRLLVERGEEGCIKGIILTWPAMNLNSYQMNKYYLQLFKCKVLNFNAINQMQNCQCNNDGREDNSEQFKAGQLCPIQIDDEVLKKWPPTYAMCGSDDFLTLDTMRFFVRLHRMGKYVKMHIMIGMPHAFLYFASMINQIKIAINQLVQGCEYIKDHIYENEYQD